MEGGKWRRRKRGLLNNGIKVHVHVREREREEGGKGIRLHVHYSLILPVQQLPLSQRRTFA